MCDRMEKTGRCPMNPNEGEISWNEKKKIIVAVAAVLVLIVGLMAWKKSEIKLSGRYKTDQSTQYIYMLPDEFVFENGYCDIGSFTCTYEYKNGTLYFYWGNAVWASFKCTINGNKIVVDNNGEYITYYKQ